MDLVSLFLIMFQCLIRMNTSSAQYFSCNNTNGNFTPGSAFGDNRNFILSSLSSNFTASGGFYSGSLGAGTDTVYAISFCKGGSKAKDCSACLNATAVDLMQKCPNQKEAIMWGAMVPTPCTIRYSNTPIQGKYETSPFILIHGPNKMNLNLTEFDQTWRNLTEGLAVEASNGSPELKYAMGESSMADVKFFAILQCSPDLSESYCRSCLEGSIDDYQSCCNGYPAAAVLKPSCILRWDFYPFDSPNASSTPSPQPVPLPSSAGNEGNNDSSRIIIVIVVVIVAMVVLLAFVPSILKKRRERKQRQSRLQWEDDDEVSTVESLQFSLATIKAITDNFSEANKLGQGGFGAVYKGRFPNGKEVAVKRLSATSRQGELEFKNEVLILAKLQHRNLVRLVGFCLQGTERLLIYEFVPNSSLDHFIFDPTKRMLLNWESRRKIIMGIARGMLYLHEDSRLRIIHRDLKASNILLDEDMNPKISDFGLAKLFSQGQIRAATNRIVGTYGYMAPEYAMWGNFSLKTDVFSFGVLILEIASGQRNNNFRNGEAVESLLSYVWKNWREETIWNIIDPSLNSASRTEIARFVHIGLLCVQKTVADRPTMGYVVSVLTSEFITLQAPSNRRSWKIMSLNVKI